MFERHLCLTFQFAVLQLILLFAVRQSLVYDRKTGEMIGFTDLGQRWNNKPNNLATHALQVYVKSVCGTPGLKYPLSYFACDSVKAPHLVSIVWESVGLLERKKLKVRT